MNKAKRKIGLEKKLERKKEKKERTKNKKNRRNMPFLFAFL